ncbi:MAG: peptide MFS transporter [Bacteroidota bacterium]|nr:peptide MFS transporter [Bacteroidota bacterium]
MSQKGHPKGLYLLYFTEMWERLSYYGMRSIFMLYMVNALLIDKEFASKIYGSFIGLVYLTPLLGGYIADHYWGNRRSIISGGVLMAIGQFFMFLSGWYYQSPELAHTLMYTGLGIAILGNGFFKPNISTMVGSLYEKGDHRVDSAFTIFYQGINIGALLAPLICGGLGERYDAAGAVIPTAFKWGFFAAFVGMSISMAGFIFLKNKFLVTPEGHAIGVSPKEVRERKGEAKVEVPMNPLRIAMGIAAFILTYCLFYFVFETDIIGSIIFSSCIVLPVMILFDPSLTKIEIHRILVIYIIAFFVIFFWSAYEQAGSSLTFFADEQTDRNIFGILLPASFFQVVNPVFIIIIAPILVSIWSFLDKRGKEPIFSVKQAIGLAMLALGYWFIALGVKGIQPWEKVSMFWLTGLYLIHTVGELCLSPIGLSMVVKMAPVRLASLMMGVWFLSNSSANKFAGNLSALYPQEVKMESLVKAEPGLISQIVANPIDTNVKNMTAKDFVSLPSAHVKFEKEKLVSLEMDSGKKEVSVYHIKLIRIVNSQFNNAVVSSDGKYLLGYKKIVKKTEGIENITEKVEIWNLQPTKPKFLGSTINNLYDFFMIFVYMAGAAAILLFGINKWLVKLMHGIR